MAKKESKLDPGEMLEKLKETAKHMGMDADETAEYAHKGMKRAGYKVTPAYSLPDDEDGDDDDDDDLMPRRRNKGNTPDNKEKKKSAFWDE